jgi:hypothetical protein
VPLLRPLRVSHLHALLSGLLFTVFDGVLPPPHRAQAPRPALVRGLNDGAVGGNTYRANPARATEPRSRSRSSGRSRCRRGRTEFGLPCTNAVSIKRPRRELDPCNRRTMPLQLSCHRRLLAACRDSAARPYLVARIHDVPAQRHDSLPSPAGSSALTRLSATRAAGAMWFCRPVAPWAGCAGLRERGTTGIHAAGGGACPRRRRSSSSMAF